MVFLHICFNAPDVFNFSYGKRRVSLVFLRYPECFYGNSNTHTHTNTNPNTNSYSNSNSDTNTYSYSDTYACFN